MVTLNQVVFNTIVLVYKYIRYLLVWLGSAGIFIAVLDTCSTSGAMKDVCTMHAIIRGEHRCAAASLWHRHLSSCSLAIGPRHLSY